MEKQCPVFQLIQAFLSAKCVLSGMNAEKVIKVSETLRNEVFLVSQNFLKKVRTKVLQMLNK